MRETSWVSVCILRQLWTSEFLNQPQKTQKYLGTYNNVKTGFVSLVHFVAIFCISSRCGAARTCLR